MNFQKSSPFRIKVSGENACFTRPEMKAERVSYNVMTPSAARGILEAVLWKRAICWRILQIDVLNPVKWESVRRNEVKKKGSREPMFIEKERVQRAGLFLRNVAYVIHAEFEMTKEAGKEDSVVKFTEMFIRRAKKGKCFHRPYFGCREFPVDFEFIPKDAAAPPAISDDCDLGWMLYDLDYSQKDRTKAQFFHAKMKNGSLDLRSVELRS